MTCAVTVCSPGWMGVGEAAATSAVSSRVLIIVGTGRKGSAVVLASSTGPSATPQRVGDGFRTFPRFLDRAAHCLALRRIRVLQREAHGLQLIGTRLERDIDQRTDPLEIVHLRRDRVDRPVTTNARFLPRLLGARRGSVLRVQRVVLRLDVVAWNPGLDQRLDHPVHQPRVLFARLLRGARDGLHRQIDVCPIRSHLDLTGSHHPNRPLRLLGELSPGRRREPRDPKRQADRHEPHTTYPTMPSLHHTSPVPR